MIEYLVELCLRFWRDSGVLGHECRSMSRYLTNNFWIYHYIIRHLLVNINGYCSFNGHFKAEV